MNQDKGIIIELPSYLNRMCDKFNKKCIDVRCCKDLRDRGEICCYDVVQVKKREEEKKLARKRLRAQ